MSDPTFLVGFQRSGTTALAGVLNAAFRAAGGCFTINGRLPYLLRRWYTSEDVRHRHVRGDEVAYALGRRAFTFPEADAWHGRARSAVEASARRVADDPVVPEVRDELRRVCRDAYGGAALWGDKYNEYLLDLEYLAWVFPAARWIFLVRDPSSVAESMGRWRGKIWNPAVAAYQYEKWAAWNGRWLRFRGSVEDDRRLELEYGALADDAAIDRLGRFTGTPVSAYRDLLGVGPAAPEDTLPELARRVWEAFADLGIVAAAVRG